MWTFRWTLFKNYSKSENRKEYIQLIKRVHMYFFLNSFCIHVTNSEKFIENLSYRKRCYIHYIHYKRGGIGERSCSFLRKVGDINATGFPPDPCHLQFAGIGLYTWALGCIHRRLAQNGGGGSYMLVLYSLACVILVGLLCHNLPLLDQGPTPYIELSGWTITCSVILPFGVMVWAQFSQPTYNMLVLGSRRRSWLYTLAFGSKYRCWIIHAGVGL